eukprot:COSAG01_NODE_3840_length_5646_cov_13.756805_4_plen_647_part_00
MLAHNSPSPPPVRTGMVTPAKVGRLLVGALLVLGGYVCPPAAASEITIDNAEEGIRGQQDEAVLGGAEVELPEWGWEARMSQLDTRVQQALEVGAAAVKALTTRVQLLEEENGGLQTQVAALSAKMSSLERKLKSTGPTATPIQPAAASYAASPRDRRLQAESPRGEVVHIHRRSVQLYDGIPGSNISPNYNGGHRRMQGQCTSSYVKQQQPIIIAKCCKTAQDCSTGAPSTCTVDCGAVFLPFYARCGAFLATQSPTTTQPYQRTAAMCRTSSASPPNDGASDRNLVHEFNLVCGSGKEVSDGCVPSCTNALRGDLLLLNLNGDDHKYSCVIQHGKMSWVGPAADGGYLGNDLQAFISSIISGASGLYALRVLAAASTVSTPLRLHPGQTVIISGGNNSPKLPQNGTSFASWNFGAGAAVEAGPASKLQLSHLQVRLARSMSVAAHADVKLNNVRFVGDSAAISVAAGGSITAIGVTVNGRPITCPAVPVARCKVGKHGAVLLHGPMAISNDGTVMAVQANMQYSGSNAHDLVSKVQTGSAGLYLASHLHGNLGVSTQMTIRAEQNVHVSGSATQKVRPAWGSGGWQVQQLGQLVVRYITVAGPVSLRLPLVVPAHVMNVCPSLPSAACFACALPNGWLTSAGRG